METHMDSRPFQVEKVEQNLAQTHMETHMETHTDSHMEIGQLQFVPLSSGAGQSGVKMDCSVF